MSQGSEHIEGRPRILANRSDIIRRAVQDFSS